MNMPNVFTVEGATPWSQLEEEVRRVPLLHPRDGEVIYPYADAEISLQEVAYSEVRPSTLYVLRNNLAIQTAITASIRKDDYHPLELEYGLVLGDKDGGLTGLIPPIVEETDEEGMYVLDGSHRTNIGRWAGRTTFNAIHITGIREDCPAYAFPNDWDEVVVRETLPEDIAKRKHYRGTDYYNLYRNFGPLNGSKPRV
jgi:hypothetical protein